MPKKIKDFLKQSEAKLALGIGLILVAVIAFEAGVLKGQNWQQKPLVIEKTGECNSQFNSPENAQNPAQEGQKPIPAVSAAAPQTVPDGRQACAFVGSKNSNKYHLPTCSYAKNIKPENIVCFKSAEDAAARGYQPDKSCVK
ncbi:MAG: Ada metal-binding domain-containing protein [Parcubacteria group bacterium]